MIHGIIERPSLGSGEDPQWSVAACVMGRPFTVQQLVQQRQLRPFQEGESSLSLCSGVELPLRGVRIRAALTAASTPQRARYNSYLEKYAHSR